MTLSAIVISNSPSSQIAGQHIGQEILQKLEGRRPHALIIFSSSKYDYGVLLSSIKEACNPDLMIGCSSAGEFTHQEHQEGAVCALALWSEELRFAASVGTNLRKDQNKAAEEMVAGFQGLKLHKYRYQTAIVMTDALAGHTDDFIQALMLQTQGKYQLVGGGAGDDAKFFETHVFLQTEAYKDAAVALEILSNEPVGIGVKHGWETASEAMRVTAAEGSRLISLNGLSSIEVIQEFAEQTGQAFEPSNPLPFFLHNVIGIQNQNGFKLRVPLAVNADGSIDCASTIPLGATIHFMRTSTKSGAEAASEAAEMALNQMNGKQPKVAIFFDCVATRLRMGVEFGLELDALSKSLSGTEFIGCNTYGQIARVEGQFSGFHNCTAVTCLLP